MASVIDICNLALSHLGDEATVVSIDPPEGSAQAEHAAKWYPIAVKAALEEHPWGFSTKRIQLVPVSNSWPEWDYAYAAPNDMVNVLAILPVDAADDYTMALQASSTPNYVPIANAYGSYQTQPYSCEIDGDGNQIVYTDQQYAVMRYTALVTDPQKFSPLFIECLSYKLAGYLAGPILKGEAGIKMMSAMDSMFQKKLGNAAESDANQRKTSAKHVVSFLANR
jgi:hypothetical protein